MKCDKCNKDFDQFCITLESDEFYFDQFCIILEDDLIHPKESPILRLCKNCHEKWKSDKEE